MTHDKHKCTKKWFIVDKEVLIKSSWANWTFLPSWVLLYSRLFFYFQSWQKRKNI
jgi:hypothetical protein